MHTLLSAQKSWHLQPFHWVENINYVIIHTKNAKNDDVLITYKIENKTKKTELVHKIIVKEDK